MLPQFPPEARDTHHTHYGVSGIRYDLPGEDLRAYNRLCVTLRAQCDGHRAPHLHIQFYNEGEILLPDKFDREGTHQVNLKNGEWTRILWEIPDLPRDKVTGIAFFNLIAGRDTTSGEYTRYEIADVSIQRVERCEHTRGWQPTGPVVRPAFPATRQRTKKSPSARDCRANSSCAAKTKPCIPRPSA